MTDKTMTAAADLILNNFKLALHHFNSNDDFNLNLLSLHTLILFAASFRPSVDPSQWQWHRTRRWMRRDRDRGGGGGDAMKRKRKTTSPVTMTTPMTPQWQC
jgi:hypothetical protein